MSKFCYSRLSWEPYALGHRWRIWHPIVIAVSKSKLFREKIWLQSRNIFVRQQIFFTYALGVPASRKWHENANCEHRWWCSVALFVRFANEKEFSGWPRSRESSTLKQASDSWPFGDPENGGNTTTEGTEEAARLRIELIRVHRSPFSIWNNLFMFWLISDLFQLLFSGLKLVLDDFQCIFCWTPVDSNK